MNHELLHPKNWKAPKGYANGIVAEGRTIFIGGQVGWNAEQEFDSADFVDQVHQALENIAVILAEAAATPEQVTRLTWYVTDKNEYLTRLREVGEAYRSVFGRHFPAMTMVQVAGLVEEGAKVEIEATAVI